GNLVTSYQYDASGNVRFVTDPRGNTVETVYDDQGRPTTVNYPATDEHLATQSATTYDVLGRRIATTDQEGKITRYRYDGLGRLVEVRQYIDQSLAAADATFAASPSTVGIASTRYSYDELGNQLTQTDALDRVTRYEYDSLGRRTSRILPDNATEALQYDEWGNLWKRTDFAGRTTTFGYDTLNRLKTKTADAAHPSLIYSHAIARVEYDYDASGARTAARTYSADNTLLYSESTPRDERGRLDTKITVLGTLDYSYYANGLLEDVVSTNPGGVNIGYRYDEANRLAFVDDASSGTTGTTAYTYTANGSLETVTAPNGIAHGYAYDSLNRLRALSVANVTAQILRSTTYALKPSGHRHIITETTGRTATYDYDGVYRLTSEAVAGVADPGQNGTVGYTLDKVGNRLNRTSSITALPATSQSFNSRDQLTSDSYDANGNTTLATGVTTQDIYDFEDRLIVRRNPDGSSINLSYDADGIRRQKTLLNAAAQFVSATGYLTDANNLTGYAQVVEEFRNNAAGLTSFTCTYGSDLISVLRVDPSLATSTSYFGYDGLGSVRFLTNASGVVTDTWDYDAFGNVLGRTGTTENNYLYRGEQFDADLGMYSLRARFYNQSTGRFWNQDSYEGSSGDPMSLHKYLYANGNPVRNSDPRGHNATIAETGFTSSLVGTLAIKLTIPAINVAATVAVNALIFAAIYETATAPAIGTRKQQLIDEELRAEGRSRASVLTRSQTQTPPIFPDPISVWHEVAEHDGFVQTLFPQWQLLHVGPRGLGAEEFIDINRDESMRASGLPPRPDMDRHEYPFASTLEGGAGAIATYVNPGSNRSQGQALAAFYVTSKLKLGDPFFVLVLP
ncbi:MAG: hypothetical protein HYV75_10620, partial [Opitutae bacterium]|nr:hypothetical protein [Opitutae bacterium]